MRIVLNGVETNNKGAELMLYAILQEVERRFPEATVFLPDSNIKQGHDYIGTKLDFRPLPYSGICNFLGKYHIPGILRRLRLPYNYISDFRIVKDIDYFIDGSGFFFSDQWNISKLQYNQWKYRLEGYKRNGAKIIFLPQAFGPANQEITKKTLLLISKTADLVFPREKVSFDYLIKSGCKADNLKICTDFTSLVKGVVPDRYSHLGGKVAIIPNLRMIDKGTMLMEDYLQLMKKIIATIRAKNKDVYLLNHEGIEDERLCETIQGHIDNVEIATGMNALEVKGLISTSYMCITSRFHGLASALNSCVPTLATSWSHKYEELYKDYGLSEMLIDLSDFDASHSKIANLLEMDTNNRIREHLKNKQSEIENSTRQMWNAIFG